MWQLIVNFAAVTLLLALTVRVATSALLYSLSTAAIFILSIWILHYYPDWNGVALFFVGTGVAVWSGWMAYHVRKR
jgi:hypothetical protein